MLPVSITDDQGTEADSVVDAAEAESDIACLDLVSI